MRCGRVAGGTGNSGSHRRVRDCWSYELVLRRTAMHRIWREDVVRIGRRHCGRVGQHVNSRKVGVWSTRSHDMVRQDGRLQRERRVDRVYGRRVRLSRSRLSEGGRKWRRGACRRDGRRVSSAGIAVTRCRAIRVQRSTTLTSGSASRSAVGRRGERRGLASTPLPAVFVWIGVLAGGASPNALAAIRQFSVATSSSLCRRWKCVSESSERAEIWPGGGSRLCNDGKPA